MSEPYRTYTQAPPAPAPTNAGQLRRRASGWEQKDVAPPIVHEVLNSPGQSLDYEAQSRMESRLGHDFSQVRVPDTLKRTIKAQTAESENADKGEVLRLKGPATGGNHTDRREFASRKRKNRRLRNWAIKELATAVAPEPAGAWVRSLHFKRTSRQTLTKS